MSRGNHRADIFREDEDYEIYLKIVERTRERYPFYLYGYCLMTNHVHLQIETTNQELWYIMKNINFIYTQYFNKKYNLIGHLLQGRYHAEIIEDDAYTLQTSRYIHLNPVKAKMVSSPVDYPWSSYDVYMGNRVSELVSEEKILSYFLDNSRELHRDYVENLLINEVVDEMIQDNLGEGDCGNDC